MANDLVYHMIDCCKLKRKPISCTDMTHGSFKLIIFILLYLRKWGCIFRWNLYITVTR